MDAIFLFQQKLYRLTVDLVKVNDTLQREAINEGVGTADSCRAAHVFVRSIAGSIGVFRSERLRRAGKQLRLVRLHEQPIWTVVRTNDATAVGSFGGIVRRVQMTLCPLGINSAEMVGTKQEFSALR